MEKSNCERCGNPGARQYGDMWFCDDCYHTCSSSDLEEGGDDLWQTTNESQSTPEENKKKEKDRSAA